MSEENKEQASTSRRKFVKIAIATAYVAPLVISMPAKAYEYGNGSGPVKKGCDDGQCDN